MSVTEEDLVNGIEHVLHELRMLVGALSLARQRRMSLSLPPDVLNPELLSLAVKASPIELPALHAAHLLGFFAAEPPGPGHLLASQYLPDFTVDADLRQRLERLRRRVAIQVAPLTVDRVSSEDQSAGPHSYSFRPGEFEPLLVCARRFVRQLLESRWLDGVPPGLRDDFRRIADALSIAAADTG